MYIFEFFRSKLWLRNCGRIIETSTENLYKNYRVCENHFKSSMFLNDLRNRLQPHAFPIPLDDYLAHKSLLIFDDQTFSNNDGKDVTNFISLIYVNIRNSIYFIDIHSSIDSSNQIISKKKQKDQQTQIEFDRKDKKIQTDSKLSSYSREQILRNKICLLQRKLQNVKQQLKRQKKTISVKQTLFKRILQYYGSTSTITH